MCGLQAPNLFRLCTQKDLGTWVLVLAEWLLEVSPSQSCGTRPQADCFLLPCCRLDCARILFSDTESQCFPEVPQLRLQLHRLV